MSALVEHISTVPLRRPVAGASEVLGWTDAFLLAERIIGQGGQTSRLSFSGGMIDVVEPSSDGFGKRRRLALRSDAGRGWRRLLRLSPSSRFTQSMFVPGLLTFLEKTCRVGLLGADEQTAQWLGAELGRHAPWHTFIPIARDGRVEQHLDLLICDRASVVEAQQTDRRGAWRPTGPTILAPALFRSPVAAGRIRGGSLSGQK